MPRVKRVHGELGHQICLLGPYGERGKQKKKEKLNTEKARWTELGGKGGLERKRKKKKCGRKSQGREQREVIEERKQARLVEEGEGKGEGERSRDSLLLLQPRKGDQRGSTVSWAWAVALIISKK